MRDIPKMWQDALADGIEDRLIALNNGSVSGWSVAGIPELEVYRGQGEPSQVWIPVKPI
ncbi:hypothetical protein [Paenibacillus xylanilyticus]|uniref:hypothetical protein n=1 Tax=Paenibacillus xylanilyticus TaxID=248903 RepID=UPI0039A36263